MLDRVTYGLSAPALLIALTLTSCDNDPFLLLIAALVVLKVADVTHEVLVDTLYSTMYSSGGLPPSEVGAVQLVFRSATPLELSEAAKLVIGGNGSKVVVVLVQASASPSPKGLLIVSNSPPYLAISLILTSSIFPLSSLI